MYTPKCRSTNGVDWPGRNETPATAPYTPTAPRPTPEVFRPDLVESVVSFHESRPEGEEGEAEEGEGEKGEEGERPVL